MDLIEDNTKEKAMSGTECGSTTESETTKNSKSKKRCESSMTKVNPKNVKITLTPLKTQLWKILQQEHAKWE